MFTGIVQGTAEVAELRRAAGFVQMRVRFPPGRTAGVTLGASVAINGTCLTVTAIEGDVLSFDVIEETLRVTNLGALAPGAAVNFERSARVGDEIGGHNVSGHVHSTATITSIQRTENNVRMAFALAAPQPWSRYILPKGYVSVDGCSLTVGETSPGGGFCVYLIPETLRVTVLGARAVGDAVNVEVEASTQAIVDTVERVLGAMGEAGRAAVAAGGAGGAGR
jgi:riboflavin synthase